MNRLAIAGLYTLIFTAMLDTSVANLALTRIAPDLSLDVLQSSMVMTSFGVGLVLSFSFTTLLRKSMNDDACLFWGAVVFMFASLGCGMAGSLESFVVFRFLQGFGSGVAIIVSQVLMIRMFGDDRRAFAIAIWSSAVSLAPVLGPPLGAYISDQFHWRLLFIINVPLTSFTLLALRNTLIPKSGPPVIDASAATLLVFAGAVCSLQFSLDFGERLSWFESRTIRLGILAAAVMFSCFLLLNNRPRFSFFEFSLFQDKKFAIGTAVLAVGNGLIITSIILLPIWLQQSYGLSILAAGVIVSISSAIAGVAVPFVGRVLNDRRYYFAIVLSLTAASVSFWLHAELQVGSSLRIVVIGRLIAGLGIALFTAALLPWSLSNLPTDKFINANAISMTLRILSSNVFLAIGFSLYERLGVMRIGQTLANAPTDATAVADPLLIAGYSDALRDVAYTSALSTLFAACALLFALGVGVITILEISSRRERRAQSNILKPALATRVNQ
ncbi:MAG: MFS transporter [Pseudomonadota bacterium]